MTTSTSVLRTTTRADWSKTAVYYAAFITIGLVSAILGPTLPALAANTGTIVGEIGFLFTARSLGYMIGSMFGARLFDRLPGHRPMAGMVVVISLTLALTPVIGQIWLLTAVLFLTGFAENMVDVGANTLIVWVHREKVGPFMSGLHFFFGVGAFLSPIVVAQVLLRSDGVAWAYWLLALVVLPVSPLLGMLPSPTARRELADTAVSHPAGQRTDKPAGPRNVPLILLIMAFFFLYVGLEIGFGGWVFTYATTLALVEETAAAYLTSAFWGALTAGRLLSIPIAARLRPRTILLLDLVGALMSVGLILIWQNSAAALWLGAIGLGFSFASIFPTTLALAERRMAITGQITGWFFVGASLGAATLPWLMGILLNSVAPTAVLWTIVPGLFLAGSVLFFIVRHEKVREVVSV
jgi:FHS family Na+ dependent glucose MFS transporter 1